MFLFMKQTMVEAQPPTTQGGNLKGLYDQPEISLSGRGTDANGAPVMYHATLVTRLLQSAVAGKEKKEKLQREYESRYGSGPQGFSSEPPVYDSEPLVNESRRSRNYLKSLRQSPYFSTDLLKAADRNREDESGYMRPRSRLKVEESGSYQALEIPDDNEAAQDVDYLVASVRSSTPYSLRPIEC